jgi:hypothetical protein
MSEHCLAVANAAATILAILMFAFFVVPLFFITFVPNPQLIADYKSALTKAQDVFVTLVLIIALSLICAFINSIHGHVRGGEATPGKGDR